MRFSDLTKLDLAKLLIGRGANVNYMDEKNTEDWSV